MFKNLLIAAALPFLMSATTDAPTAGIKKTANEMFVETKWGVTKTQFQNGSHSTNSESFQETWVLQIKNGKIFLSSPRAQIELIGMKLDSQESLDIESLRLTRAQLFELLGIEIAKDVLNALDADMRITLSRKEGGLGTTKTLSYNLENEQQLQIDLAINSATP